MLLPTIVQTLETVAYILQLPTHPRQLYTLIRRTIIHHTIPCQLCVNGHSAQLRLCLTRSSEARTRSIIPHQYLPFPELSHQTHGISNPTTSAQKFGTLKCSKQLCSTIGTSGSEGFTVADGSEGTTWLAKFGMQVPKAGSQLVSQAKTLKSQNPSRLTFTSVRCLG
jgi:hypothetical protein